VRSLGVGDWRRGDVEGGVVVVEEEVEVEVEVVEVEV
jgi:hypothetical protein